MRPLKHTFKFDPSYGYSLEELLLISTPEEPPDYDAFWQRRYERAIQVDPAPSLYEEKQKNGWREFKFSYQTTDNIWNHGWALLPMDQAIDRVVVSLHGYGGIEEPYYDLRVSNTAMLFPCARGISRSKHKVISSNPLWHVVHDIQDRDRYVHGGCVEDTWLAISAARRLFTEAAERIGFTGISFGGGIGAMALGYDKRVKRAHLNVPSFGNHPLRMSLQTTGSGAAVQAILKRKPEFLQRTLAYYDAAVSAKRITIPVHCACALFDPMVAPPGQFSVYNAIGSEKTLTILRAGHHEYPQQEKEGAALLQELNDFFDLL